MVTKKSIRKYLQQLKIKELHELAKKKGIKIPPKWKKSQIVELLELNVSQSELKKLFPKAETPTKRYIKGLEFEQKVKEWFEKKGYKCKTREKKKTRDGIIAEFDIIGWKKEKGFFGEKKEWIFVECKNVDEVTPSEWHKFLGKYESFRKKHKDEKVMGWLCTTGLFHPNVEKEKAQYKTITLKRFSKL